ncbi:reductase or disulfide isomerase in copper uptake, YcnL [Bacillus sp. JCM 19046]|nr:reductase or disulfide isomerase in copper uptake, YcnL [Bacillus sp. JCM 19045]GAF18459.1 reductase or disulfide isomerase in copper uptake, YcnL [Bacillus sp. JCM 19046]
MNQQCPSYQAPFTVEALADSNVPFVFTCAHCKSRIYEMKVTALLLIPTVGFVALMIFLSEYVRGILSPSMPFLENVPTGIVALVFFYPLYYLGQKELSNFLYKRGTFFARKRAA